ncbi:hypothetical protein Cob_v013152 [Colletotrichum orbiculare MAFF 240422]|uniref:Uncharacterized protein n=1 Tax=Colletotrichum orbiculare (strain 104-T / ATCC 96160 / CBS 514.97 / LARS 414 / MAFF 240422) TaxID=1213857 RepID=A0A484F8H1_COLOR|nr:hypothetical protein Cob_v013152 [Colletotrichum orbiculare MAFF 240422]
MFQHPNCLDFSLPASDSSVSICVLYAKPAWPVYSKQANAASAGAVVVVVVGFQGMVMLRKVIAKCLSALSQIKTSRGGKES